MSFDAIDPALEAWAGTHKIKILREDGDGGRRYFYTSSSSGETFQIVIEPEKNKAVRIDAHLIESAHDEEAHFIWEVLVTQVINALDLSLASAQAWFRRVAA